jgi:hypothetical protein
VLKRDFTTHEQHGLTQEEIKLGRKWLRKHKTAGRIPTPKALELFEFYLIGHSFSEIQRQFPQYPAEQIIMTAALSGWAHDRDNMMTTLRDRVQARVVKSIIEQVDFLTAMLGVVNTQHLDNMRKYMMDPAHNPAPALKIESIKDYKEVVETLHKIVTGSNASGKNQESMLHKALESGARRSPPIEKVEDGDGPTLLELANGEDNESPKNSDS